MPLPEIETIDPVEAPEQLQITIEAQERIGLMALRHPPEVVAHTEEGHPKAEVPTFTELREVLGAINLLGEQHREVVVTAGLQVLAETQEATEVRATLEVTEVPEVIRQEAIEALVAAPEVIEVLAEAAEALAEAREAVEVPVL